MPDYTLRLNVTPTLSARGHNWIVHRAFQWIEDNCPTLMPPISESYVHYGLAFADDVGIGRPEDLDRTYPDVRPDLPGAFDPLANDDGSYGYVQLRFRRGPNLFLEAEWKFEILGIDLRDEPITCSADAISHFANLEVIRTDGTGTSHDPVVQGPNGEGHWAISASAYARTLHDLAVAFIPGPWPGAQLKKLRLVEHPGEITNSILSANWWRGYHVQVPATFVGGNPFVLTKEGRATWPIWVPEEFSVEGLIEESPEKSLRTAAIYLGWALHMVGDISVPFHAADTHGTHHQAYEDIADAVLAVGLLDHLPIGVGGRFKYSNMIPLVDHAVDPKMALIDSHSIPDYLRSIGDIMATSRHLYDFVRADRSGSAAPELSTPQAKEELRVNPSYDILRRKVKEDRGGSGLDEALANIVATLEVLTDAAIKTSIQMTIGVAAKSRKTGEIVAVVV